MEARSLTELPIPRLERLRDVLVVDDDAQVRKLCRNTLAGAGYLVSEAADGREALALVDETLFDVIVLDLCMPDMDGLEFLSAVRSGMPRLKIVGISGFMGGAMLHAAKLSGAAATLLKPFSPDALLSIVAQVLDNTVLKPPAM